jgi:CBS domain-containing protein
MNVGEIMKRDLIVIDSDAKISEAISKMKDNDIQQLPVISNGKYVSMLTYKNILRRGSVRTNSRVYNFSINAPKLDEKTDVMDAVKLLKESGLNALPVFQKEKLAGLVTRMDVIRHLSEIDPRSDRIKNFEIMTSDAISVDVDDEIEESAQKIRTLDEYEIPVTSKGKLSGILRLKEIINNVIMDKQKISYGEYTSGKSKVEIVASSLMDNPVSSSEDSVITDTASLMIKNHLHVIPIVDKDSRLTGVVGITDILNSIETGNEEGFYIEISGLNEQDRDLYDITYFMADKFITNIARIVGNNGKLLFNVRKYKTEGKGKYSVRTKLITPKLHMEDDGSGYNYGKCIRAILDNYESRIKGK